MGLCELYSCNVEIKYKSYVLSKATLFTMLTTFLNIVLPLLIAQRSRGFWLNSHSFYEQPILHSTYDYLLIAETVDPSQTIVCGDAINSNNKNLDSENCSEIQIQEYDYNKDGKNDALHFIFNINLIPEYTVTSVIIILSLDFQLQTTCPLHMQSLAVVNKEFTSPISEFKFYGDLQFYQISHLPCLKNTIDIKFNTSILNQQAENNIENHVDLILENYFKREVTTQIQTTYSRSLSGYTGTQKFNINLRVPEMKILYRPSFMQELKWAWPQYLSLVAIFYWILNKVKKFVFNKRLLMALEIVPWKKN